jgi:uncharacterized protein
MNESISSDIGLMRILVAKTFWQRALGLIGRSRLDKNEGLYFPHARAIHTFGMLRTIDVVYLDATGLIIAIRGSIKPCRFSYCRDARSLCELSQGRVQELGLKTGQQWPFTMNI